MNRVRRLTASVEACGLLLTMTIACSVAVYSQNPNRPAPITLGTTVPANGDQNPYGVALVPRTVGKLVQGRFLVSNFNNAGSAPNGNLQGTGTTIVQMAPNGSQKLFAQIAPSTCKETGGVGLTTALVALQSGFVVVGSLPTTDGTAATIRSGCLIILDSNGNVVGTVPGNTNSINGPWDMTAVEDEDHFVLFVTNVLNGLDLVSPPPSPTVDKGTVVRLLFEVPENGGAPQLQDSLVIASGFPERTDPAALVIGPTGVAYDPGTGNLFVADSLENRIAAIPNALTRNQDAGTGVTVSAGGALNDPLGVSLTGHFLFVANGDDGNIVEVDVNKGRQVNVSLADSSGGPPPGAGALFGLWALNTGQVYFVDDATNTFNLLH